MKITNKHNLPDAIVKAIQNDSYSRGDAKYSASQLIAPPQITRLTQLHYKEITKDVSEQIWSLFGTAVHYIIENAQAKEKVIIDESALIKLKIQGLLGMDLGASGGYVHNTAEDLSKYKLSKINELVNKPMEEVDNSNGIITEDRMYSSIMGVKISGQLDWYNVLEGLVNDFKVTKAYKAMKHNPEWEEQQNIYAWLLRENGEKPQALQIIAILKDWNVNELKSKEGYPVTPVATINLPMWSYEKQTAFVLNKVGMLERATSITDDAKLADEFPCSNEDKWQAPTIYKVMKKGGKRAVNGGSFTEKAPAYAYAKEKGAEHFVNVKKGYNRRCEDFCDVKDFCIQRKRELGELNKNTSVSVEPKVIAVPKENLVKHKINIAEALLKNKKKVATSPSENIGIKSTEQIKAEIQAKATEARRVVEEREAKKVEAEQVLAIPDLPSELTDDNDLDDLLDDLEGLV